MSDRPLLAHTRVASAPRSARGFSLVSAVFLLVVLTVLGVALVTLASVQHTTQAQQLQSLRASYALRAGIDWAATQGLACPAATSTLSFPGYPGFQVAVTCRHSQHPLEGASCAAALCRYVVIDVTVTSSGNYGGPDYVRRRAQAKVML